MQFCEALAVVCTEPIAKDGAFRTYAKLCDLCKNDFESVKKITLFYQIDRKLSVAYHIQTEGRLAVPVLSAAYPAVKSLISREGYDALISTVAKVILDPESNEKDQGKTGKQTFKAVIKKNRSVAKATETHKGMTTELSQTPIDRNPSAPAPQKRTVAVANVIRANPPVVSQTKSQRRFSSTPYQISGSSHIDFGSFIKWIFIGILSCGYFVGTFFLYRYVGSAELATWAKWLIGISMVIATLIIHILPADFSGIISITDFPLDMESTLLQPILCGITLLETIFCRILFGGQINFLIACVMITLLPLMVWFPCTVSWDFSDFEDLFEYLCPIEIFIDVIVLAFAFSFSLFMQWLVGIAFAVIFIFIIWKVAYDDNIAEYGLPAFSSLIVLLANVVLLFIFKEQYRVIFHWVAATCAIHSVYQIWYCFNDRKTGFGVFTIFNGLLGIGEFIIPFFLPIF